jgi:hypothetical protein
MSAGTLALTNKSDAVKGTGTTFTAMKAGDFIVVSIGGTPYTLTVKSITSDTQLTLISKFTGPTQSGLAWHDVPREAQSLITAALATQTVEALRGQNLDKDNWQQIFSVSDDITVTLRDGSQFTGPSWLKIVDLLKTLDLAQAQKIADQLRQSQNAVAADKATVAADRGVVESKAAEAAASAQAAAQHEQAASDSAGTASQKATDATAEAERAERAADDAEIRGAEQVGLATAQADRAKEEADRAAASNPANALLKAENLADVENKAQALQNLLDEKPLPLSAPAVNPNDAVTLQQAQNMGGATGPTQTGVMNFCIGAKRLHDSRNYIPQYEVAADGQLLNREDWPDLWAYAQMIGVITDSVWRGDVGQRAKYSDGDGAVTFRVPDFNGVQKDGVNGFAGDDSIQSLYGRGDGGAGGAGSIHMDGAPNATGTVSASPPLSSNTMNGAGVFRQSSVSNTSSILEGTAKPRFGIVSFSLNDSNPIYGRSPFEIRTRAFVGVWVIRASGAFVAANTSFGVMNSYAAGQPANSLLEGGRVQSEIRVEGAVSAKAALVAKQRVGGEAWAAIEITDASGSQQTVKTIDIPNLNGATFVTNLSQGYVSAWVWFDGRSSGANNALPIMGSHNISSVAYLGGGIYQINFGRPMADTNYGVAGMIAHGASDSAGAVIEEINVRSVNGVRVKTRVAGDGRDWSNSVATTVAIFGKGAI